jgi:two-component system OmpR family response regulator
MKVLLIEDSLILQDRIGRALRKAGYAVDSSGDGVEGLALAQARGYDVIVLDLLLPGLDGLSLLSHLRHAGSRTHVLILTARDAPGDRVRGLRAGADDYLVKPFDFDELLARVDALARRSHDVKDPRITVADLVVDTSTKKAYRGDLELDLQPREYALLEYLAMHRGKPVSRVELEAHIYDERKEILRNAIDSAVCSLRTKLEVAGSRPHPHATWTRLRARGAEQGSG